LQAAMTAGEAAGFQNGLPGLTFTKPAIVPGEPLKLELAAFVEAVRTRMEPVVTGAQGRAALELALTIQRAMVVHAEGAGLGGFFRD
jgi:predicted dehydrogenase